MNDATDNGNESWLASAPTWLHLLTAVLGLAGGMVLFLTQIERRFTIIEERQATIRQTLRESNEAAELFRREVIGKLDTVGTQMTLLTLEFAKHQARYESGTRARVDDDDVKPRYKAQP